MSCDKLLLFEVYGTRNELVPWLPFCDEHWGPAKRRRNDEGQRMGVQLLKPEEGPVPCAEDVK